MAPPAKPLVPLVTARSAGSLTIDWPSAAGLSYVVRVRAPAGPIIQEIAVSNSPATLGNLVANEQYGITIEALNSDGGSGESDAALAWTDPPSPQTPPVVYVFVNIGVVSIGWDLTPELTPVHHADLITVEVGRSDAANPVARTVGSGAVRGLSFDPQAPNGQLRYQLRLRADRPSPEAPAFSPWGPAVPVIKPEPLPQPRPGIDRMAQPLIGGRASQLLAMLRVTEGDEEKDDDDSDKGQKSDDGTSGTSGGGHQGEKTPFDGGHDAGGGNSGGGGGGGGSGEGKQDGPSDDDEVDEKNVDPYFWNRTDLPGPGPSISIDIGHGLESKQTPDGDFVRDVVQYAGQDRWEARSPWLRVSSDNSDPSGGRLGRSDAAAPTGPSRVSIDSPSKAREGDFGKVNSFAEAAPAHGSDFGSERTRHALEGSSSLWQPAEQFAGQPSSRPQRNVGMTFRTDRGDARQASPDSFDAAGTSRPRPRRTKTTGSPSRVAGGLSLLDSFLNTLRSATNPRPSRAGPSRDNSHRSTARRSGTGRLASGTPETNAAIREAAEAYRLDANFMRAIASIESQMNPGADAHPSHLGLYQFGADEWRRYGAGGNIFNARDNARAAARYFAANARILRRFLHRDPTNTELYISHQQGAGFYTRNITTNLGGNPYPGMDRHRTPTPGEFEAGWGAEIERRMRYFESLDRGTTDPTIILR